MLNFILSSHFYFFHLIINSQPKKGTNEVNESLLKNINEEAKIHMVPSKINEVYFIRFAVVSANSELNHMDYAWNVIVKTFEKLTNYSN